MAKSKTSEDIAIPDINNCRECHSGQLPAKNKVTSTCESCHGFHLGSPKRGARAAAPEVEAAHVALGVDMKTGSAHTAGINVAVSSPVKARAHP